MASDIKVNNIKSYSGNTLNLGDTGDTINLTGASFNGTSSVIWNTTPKTSAFTATAGSGFFVDTTSATITATLPASPSAGDIIAFKDYAETFATNNFIIARNGNKIQGSAENSTITTNRASLVLVYVDATKGWLFTNESNVGNLTATAPNAPTIGTATATSQTTATVTFTAPADDGGEPITQYTATSSPDGITGTLNQAGSGTITVSGLTKETAYTFTVTATNAIGTSAASAASNSITTPGDFVAATGGTVTTSGDFKIHTFTSSGTFTVTSAGAPGGSTTVDFLVVAGGAGGGGGIGGGGGAGGYRESFPNPATGGHPVSIQAYPITVGSGGNGGPDGSSSFNSGSNGSNSVFSTITSSGGGGGGSGVASGGSGGSGGGGGGGSGGQPGGSGNSPSVTPPQGNPGGSGVDVPGNNSNAGGGGGAGASGSNGSAPSGFGQGGPGGNGTSSSITGSSVTRGGGGGGNSRFATPSSLPGSGGSGGGGAGGGGSPGQAAVAGTANTGGGGGGGDFPQPSNPAANGGSGIVVIRYKFQ